MEKRENGEMGEWDNRRTGERENGGTGEREGHTCKSVPSLGFFFFRV